MSVTLHPTVPTLADYQQEQGAALDSQASTHNNPAVVNQQLQNAALLNAPALDHVATPAGNIAGVSASSVAFNAVATHNFASTVPNLPMNPVNRETAPSPRQVLDVVSSLSISDSEAFRIIRQAGQKVFDSASQLSLASNNALIGEKLGQVSSLKDQIAGEQKSATTQLGFAVLGATASAGLAIKGNSMRNSVGTENAALKLEADLAKVPKGSAHNAERDALYLKFSDDLLRKVEPQKHAEFVKAERLDKIDDEIQKQGLTTAHAKENARQKITADAERTYMDSSKATPSTADFSHVKILELASSRHIQLSGDPRELMRVVKNYMETRDKNPLQRLGEQINHSPDGQRNIGAGLDQSANALGQVITQYGTLSDKMYGGLHDADQARIQQKIDDVNISMAQQTADAGKAAKDRALKTISDSIDALKDMVARHAAVVDKIG